MIKRIAAVALAGTALAMTVAGAASAAESPNPNTGGVTGVPTSIYPDGLNNLNDVNQMTSSLSL
ncbi:hypothetical protein [Embleya sp. NBC_00896]|uniref:hypothetical protein n=1 Tax=Embleya sp. NBC_00896 TaxID=2975961 RepID=UPI002F91A021|nr:hypothetical protein OG928_40095 [Embleya sp. NBC_00896]